MGRKALYNAAMDRFTEYTGNTFAVDKYLKHVQNAAARNNFTVTRLDVPGQERPVLVLTRPADKPGAKNVYICGGVHGDEPAGSLTILRMLAKGSFPRDVNLTLVPLINPEGMSLNQREDNQGHDLNRDFMLRHTPTVQALTRHFAGKPFDMCIDLHEDWEATGFYLYNAHMNNDTLDRDIINAVKKRIGEHFRMEPATIIDGFNAKDGVIDLAGNAYAFGSSELPQAVSLVRENKGYGFVMETPSNTALKDRVDQLSLAVSAALDTARSRWETPEEGKQGARKR